MTSYERPSVSKCSKLEGRNPAAAPQCGKKKPQKKKNYAAGLSSASECLSDLPLEKAGARSMHGVT
jgi:hypothetical protein